MQSRWCSSESFAYIFSSHDFKIESVNRSELIEIVLFVDRFDRFESAAMTYYSRGARLPALSQHNAESIYWSAFDDTPHVVKHSRSRSRRSSLSSRQYIDPWDLENYAYIQRHVENSPSSGQSNVNAKLFRNLFFLFFCFCFCFDRNLESPRPTSSSYDDPSPSGFYCTPSNVRRSTFNDRRK